MLITRKKPIIEVKPVRMYADVDTEKRGTVAGNRFTLPKMEYDGIYALKITAVDAAGNESEPNINTYARMADHDVLAYIEGDSLYSFQYENGDAISKRADDFRDIVIHVIAREDSDIRVVLRDNNGNEISTDAGSSKLNNEVYGICMSDYTVESAFFKDCFPDDTDIRLYLSVKSGDGRIDLGKIHSDNIAPTCQLPAGLKSWQWYYGDGTRTFVISGINEPLKEWKLYDNGTELIPEYSPADGTLTFTLGEGWHNIGIVLTDMAGNTCNVQELSNIHVGYFWLEAGMGAGSPMLLCAMGIVGYRARKKRKLENE